MDITMKTIKLLREKCGAGIVDCKKALEEASGNIEKAVEILRKNGIAKAAKRSSREANQGIIMIATNESGTEGYIVEINSETDFVARNEQFQQFAKKILAVIKNNKPDSMAKLMELEMDNSTVQENLDNLSGIIGEKLGIKRYEILFGATVAAYSHMKGKIGVLAAIDKAGEQELAHDIAMQIAAANPKYITPDKVPAEEIEKEKEIYREQLLKEGKPENIIDKILSGKINKYFAGICLIKQEYIKDDTKQVENILKGVKVEKFIRYSL